MISRKQLNFLKVIYGRFYQDLRISPQLARGKSIWIPPVPFQPAPIHRAFFL